jgi:hypothetical protein
MGKTGETRGRREPRGKGNMGGAPKGPSGVAVVASTTEYPGVLSSTTWEVKLPARSRFKTGKGKEGACYGGRRGVSQRSSYGATPRP